MISALNGGEKEIAALEKELLAHQTAYTEHATQGASNALQESAKRISVTQRRLDKLYADLEEALLNRDSIQAEYAKRMEMEIL